MFIAFEGPDKVGKSTSARELDCAEQPGYQVTKQMYEADKAAWQGNGGDHERDPMPHSYDRISWLSHMVYRLALPDTEWHDQAVRTVFAMPDTHLVFKVHRPELADFKETNPDSRTGLVIDTPVALVNPVYWSVANWLITLNYFKDYSLFKSISVIEVSNTPEGYQQLMLTHDNPTWDHGHDKLLPRMVDSNDSLLDFLHDQDKLLG